MRKWLTVIAACLTPVAAVGALIYQIIEGKVTSPIGFALIVIVPTGLVSAFTELSKVLAPGRVKITVKPGARLTHWIRGSVHENRTGQVTSVYLPVELKNGDPSKRITLQNVTVVDLDSGAALAPPALREISVGSEKHWAYGVCDFAFVHILNAGKTTVAPGATVDEAIALEEPGIHRPGYQLEIRLEDNFGRTYHLIHQVGAQPAPAATRTAGS
jgi:hypothetical protein